MFLKILQYSQENACVVVSFNQVAGLKASNFILKKALTQVFSYKYCEIFKNNLFIEHLQQ